MREVDLAIIGAGVAGLTAATVAARQGLDVLVIERMACGGQVMNVEQVSNFGRYPAGISGFELGPVLQEEAEEAGAQFLLDVVESLSVRGELPIQRSAKGLATPARHLVRCASETIAARAVIVAAGSARRKLGVPGEEAVEGRGVSHCASCDGPLFRGADVCVVGGGDSAVSEALVLASHARRVTLAFPGDALHAQSYLTKALAALPNVHQMPKTRVVEIAGSPGAGGHVGVSGVKLQSCGAGASALHELPAQGVFVYAGLVADTGFLGTTLRLDAQGRIETDASRQTSVPGIFAAGDIRAGCDWRLSAAAEDGEAAAQAAIHNLRHGD